MQRISAGAMETSLETGWSPAIGLKADNRPRSRTAIISPYAFFGMVILAMIALCFSVTMRTHAEVNTAAQQHQQMQSDVEKLRNTNASLATEVKRLRNDPRAIEAAARARLGMVRPNEIIVAVD
jgi:cell division protein FtsL